MAKKKVKSTKKKTTAKKAVKRSTAKSRIKKTKRITAKKTTKKKTPKVKSEVIELTQDTIAQTSPEQTQSEQQTPKKESQIPKVAYSKEDLEHFKQILLKKREEILEMLEYHKQSLIESTTQNDKPIGTPYSIHMEYGTETEEREKTMFFIAREEKMLNYIDAALMRIERGTYGVCISCGKLIDKRRLEAVPHTQLCITCKLAQKKKF
ncbi:MAG: TraR/DksA family transcriptional regulator [Candidatus Kryptonium sp.]|nr:TraR/DksA family transcriptional regulator [Candidatus Kryptonium sp.]MCX7761595.1 TraR/DksA family transcriptional regulator [Candidatus Kryptonium sp.]MDW8108497.1 TraR/DksA family transcriptional regulator [Candidatus Kryptonium sp.]